MPLREVWDALELLFFIFKLCAFVVGLFALPFAIAAHSAKRKQQAKAMRAKASELDLGYS